jgi:GT2 family glycosyltransferase
MRNRSGYSRMPSLHESVKAPSDRAVDISIVIPTYNGSRTITECLQSVERAARDHRHEIIVADSSSDATPDIVARDFANVRLIRSAQRLSAGAARNRAAGEARGRLIFFTDQDCIVPDDWINRLRVYFDDPNVHGAGGAVAMRNLSSPSGCAIYFLEFLNHFPARGAPRRDDNFLVGCNAAYRAEVLRSIRFPDQTLGEDVLFAERLRSAGFHTIYDARIAVLHQNREGWREFFRYNHKMGRAAADYQAVRNRWWARPFLRQPFLAYAAPLAILPAIALYLLRSRLSYLVRFVMLAPICFLGNLAWADGFRQHQLGQRAGSTSQASVGRVRSTDLAEPSHETAAPRLAKSS